MEKIQAILFGATGMIGNGVLIECLDSAEVGSVLVITRRSTGKKHEKLKEIIHDNFLDYSTIEGELSGYNACFFCLLMRPAYIQPLKGVKPSYFMYKVLKPLYPLLKRLFPKYVTNTEVLGQAMINAVLYGAEKHTLENKDPIQLAKTSK